MRADLMLAWMSEIGAGDVGDLRQRVAWLARNADISPQPYETGRWLRDLSALAHVEIDWAGGRWAIVKAAGVLLPECGGTVVLTGSRRLGLVEKLGELISVQTLPGVRNGARLETPAQVYLQADSVDELVSAMTSCGVAYSGLAAEHLANRLPSLSLGQRAAPPAFGSPMKHLETARSIRLISGRLTRRSGLCEITVQGRPSYLYLDGNDWFHTSYADGVLWALAEDGVGGLFRWRQERSGVHEALGTLFVDQGVPLPPLQSRTLVLCSGQPASFSEIAKTAMYRNVPISVGEKVARSCRQQLEIIK